MKKFIPWIFEDTIRYKFGIRKRAFEHLNKHDINKAFFCINPSSCITENLICETIESVQEIAILSKQYSITPLFVFSVYNYNNYSVNIIPKCSDALKYFLKYLDTTKVEEIDTISLSEILVKYRNQFLIGCDIYDRETIRSGYERDESIYIYCDDIVKNEHLKAYNSEQYFYPFDFYFLNEYYNKNPEYASKFQKKCEKYSIPLVYSKNIFSSGYNIERFNAISPQETVDTLKKHNEDFAEYTLHFSIEKVLNKIDIYDALKVIDSII